MAKLSIFKVGKHTTKAGQEIEFSEVDLRASAAAYDPQVHEAPLVVGHPKDDAPAYGWVKALQFADGELQADPDQVQAEFAELVAAGRYKHLSAAFYRPDSQQNPVPGTYYLRHVGFLGAQPPAVKGLGPAQFREGDGEELVELEVAFAEGWKPRRAGEPEALTEADLQRQMADLAKRKADLDRREAELGVKERVRGVEAFCEQLEAAGKVLPAERSGLVAFMAGIEDSQVVEFGEGADAVEKPAGDWLRDFLAGLPKRVEYAEVGAPEPADQPIEFASPAGCTVDQERLALDRKAQAYMRQHNTDYVTAVQAVEAGQ